MNALNLNNLHKEQEEIEIKEDGHKEIKVVSVGNLSISCRRCELKEEQQYTIY